jgi:hypothetical protein
MKASGYIETKDIGSKDLVFETQFTMEEMRNALDEQDRIFRFHLEEVTTEDGHAIIRLIPDRGMAVILDKESILLAHDGGGGKGVA